MPRVLFSSMLKLILLHHFFCKLGGDFIIRSRYNFNGFNDGFCISFPVCNNILITNFREFSWFFSNHQSEVAVACLIPGQLMMHIDLHFFIVTKLKRNGFLVFVYSWGFLVENAPKQCNRLFFIAFFHFSKIAEAVK